MTSLFEKVYKKGKRKQITININPDVFIFLEKEANIKDIPIRTLVKMIISEYVYRKKHTNLSGGKNINNVVNETL